MEKETTKDLIVRNALKLFAEKGFAAVSMRDLAEAVGISASTIYHYYESKQVLFRDMIRRTEELTARARDSFMRVLDSAGKVEREPFIHAGVMFATAYLRHEQIDPLLRMLESERYHDPAAEETWRKLVFTAPIDHETKVFEMLAERGEIRNGEAAALAGEYHGIVMLGYFTGDTERMAGALGAFYDRVFTGEGGKKP